MNDTLVFSRGKFESTECTAMGFPKTADYTADVGGAFHSTSRHPDGTIADWKGNVKGNAVEGTVALGAKGTTKPGQFRGTLRQ